MKRGGIWAAKIHRLFDSIAKVVAEILEYDYPLEAEKCAERYIQINIYR